MKNPRARPSSPVRKAPPPRTAKRPAQAAAVTQRAESVADGLPTPKPAGRSGQAPASVAVLPAAMAEAHSAFMSEASELWNRLLQPGGAAIAPADRRFAGGEWLGNPGSSFLAEMYLLNARALKRLAEAVEADAKTKARIRFAVQQWIDSTAPSNYLAFNPEAQQKALATQGESLRSGLGQLVSDLQRGHLSQTDESAFEVGRNVAMTEGAVVFENELFQLLEYRPLTATVHERPLLIVPPCINKFYILDLQPENSLIRYAVSEGHRVFVISWKNAGEEIAQRTWDDYIETAAIRAIALVQEIGGTKQINTLGFCIGGTILACALAVLAARGRAPAASMTLLTTFLDFSDTGILDIFIDEGSVRLREMTIGAESGGGGSLLKGQELATTFSLLRPNELVWNYVVGNYLKGETPPPFDLLYWNSDGTNLPGPMYCWYLRNTYLENKLAEPGRLVVCGEKIDLGKIAAPAYIYGSREDHIVPWQGAYRSTQVLRGERRFVLGASGHIAGVINPPQKKKRSHWIHAGKALPAAGADWLAGAEEHAGSWWGDWSTWLSAFGGRRIPAPKTPGNRKYKAIEPAPGRYVKERV